MLASMNALWGRVDAGPTGYDTPSDALVAAISRGGSARVGNNRTMAPLRAAGVMVAVSRQPGRRN
jgi:hypothetical protein